MPAQNHSSRTFTVSGLALKGVCKHYTPSSEPTFRSTILKLSASGSCNTLQTPTTPMKIRKPWKPSKKPKKAFYNDMEAIKTLY